MEHWSMNVERLSVTTREEAHRSDETPRSTSDLLALRAKRTLLHRVPEPAYGHFTARPCFHISLGSRLHSRPSLDSHLSGVYKMSRRRPINLRLYRVKFEFFGGVFGQK